MQIVVNELLAIDEKIMVTRIAFSVVVVFYVYTWCDWFANSVLISFQESVSGFRRGGSAEQFFSVVKEKLKPQTLAIPDSWTEMMFKDFEPEKNDLGRLFPFVGRDKQIALLGRLITDLMR